MSDQGTAVVTGAGQGIGRAVAQRLARDGYDVLAVDRSDAIHAVAEEIGVRSAVADVTDDAAVAGLAALAPDCRVVVNNAAIQIYVDLLRTTHEEMRHLLDVNVIGPVLVSQALVPVMAANGGGSIVNLSSIVSRAHAATALALPDVEGGDQPAHAGRWPSSSRRSASGATRSVRARC